MARLVGPWRYSADGRVVFRALIGPNLDPLHLVNQVARIDEDKGIFVRHRDSEGADNPADWVRSRAPVADPDEPEHRRWCDNMLMSLGYEFEDYAHANLDPVMAAVRSAFASAVTGTVENWEIELICKRIGHAAQSERQRLERQQARGRGNRGY